MNHNALLDNSTANMSGHDLPDKPDPRTVNSFRRAILKWYDAHRRVLPWRAAPGVKPDPYHVWLSEIMLQQTVVATVMPYFLKFIEKWPRVTDLAAAPVEDVMKNWAGLGYYTRARNLHKCAQIVVNSHKGRFPSEEAALLALPGIGPYTAAAISAIAFNKPFTVMDGNIERVMARYFEIDEPLPAAKKTLYRYAQAVSEGRSDRPGDFAQALMDIGATVCIPKSPRCGLCPAMKSCRAYAAGTAAQLPRRDRKKPKPQRFGNVYWITNGRGHVLAERRPARNLLGGMVGLPTSEWGEAAASSDNHCYSSGIIPAKLKSAGVVMHSFTHFNLTLQGWSGQTVNNNLPPGGPLFWIDIGTIGDAGLPSLFRKFAKLMT